jgi:hypothetical protein
LQIPNEEESEHKSSDKEECFKSKVDNFMETEYEEEEDEDEDDERFSIQGFDFQDIKCIKNIQEQDPFDDIIQMKKEFAIENPQNLFLDPKLLYIDEG